MRSEHVPLLPEPVKLIFEHNDGGKNSSNEDSSLDDGLVLTNRACGHWDEIGHSWSRRGCKTLSSNATHSRCVCAHFGMVALLAEVAPISGGAGGSTSGGHGPGWHVTVVVAVMAAAVAVFCVVVGLALGLDYFRRTRPVSTNLLT